MKKSINISNDLYEKARISAHIENKTIDAQIEFWAEVGKAAIDNQDLSISFVVDSLKSLKEPKNLSIPFVVKI